MPVTLPKFRWMGKWPSFPVVYLRKEALVRLALQDTELTPKLIRNSLF